MKLIELDKYLNPAVQTCVELEYCTRGVMIPESGSESELPKG